MQPQQQQQPYPYPVPQPPHPAPQPQPVPQPPESYAPPPAYTPAPQYSPPPPAPQGYTPPAPAYGPPPQYGPPPGYPPPYAQQPPPPPTVPGTLDQFYAQPSTGGGKALAFDTPGTSYRFVVSRPIGNGDIAQMTDPVSGRPSTFKDGSPKFVMKVPCLMTPTPAYPDGIAQWWVKGVSRDELVRAMAEVGAPEGPPEAGSIITVTMTGTRPAGAGMSPTKLFQVVYERPQGAEPTPAAVPRVNGGEPPAYTPPDAQPPVPPATPSAYQPAPPPIYATNGNGATAAQAPATPAASAPPPPPPPVAPPVELSPAQQQLLASLTGQPTS
jgi:hypothetical protein